MHVSDGVLSISTCVVGYVAAGGLVAYGLAGAKDADVPRTGILTAAFFLAGLVRAPLPGTSVHLLMAGLNGIALGRSCFPSIFMALLLQAVLLGHGGLSTLGVNTVLMAVPAYLAGVGFHAGIRRSMPGRWLFGATLAALCFPVAKFSADLMADAGLIEHTISWGMAAPVGMGAGVVLYFVLDKFLNLDAVNRWGFSAGALAVAGGAFILYLLLSYAPLAGHMDREGFADLARFAFLGHAPVFAIEGAVTALLIRYLDTVTPELLRLDRGAAAERSENA